MNPLDNSNDNNKNTPSPDISGTPDSTPPSTTPSEAPVPSITPDTPTDPPKKEEESSPISTTPETPAEATPATPPPATTPDPVAPAETPATTPSPATPSTEGEKPADATASLTGSDMGGDSSIASLSATPKSSGTGKAVMGKTMMGGKSTFKASGSTPKMGGSKMNNNNNTGSRFGSVGGGMSSMGSSMTNMGSKMVPQGKFKQVVMLAGVLGFLLLISMILNIFSWTGGSDEEVVVQEEDTIDEVASAINPTPPRLQPQSQPQDSPPPIDGSEPVQYTQPDTVTVAPPVNVNLLGVPTNLSGESGAYSITLWWDTVQDATHYDLAYCGGDIACSGFLAPIRNIEDTTYTLSGLQAKTRYSFRAIAKNDTTVSMNWSPYVTIKTKSDDSGSRRSSGGSSGDGGDDSDNTQSVSPGQYPTPTVSAYLTVDTNTEYYDGDANNVATNIIPYDSYLIINSNVPATVSNPNDDPNDPNDDEVANPNNPVRYDISVCFREVTSSSWECKDYATNVATLGTDPNSNDYSLRYEIYDINDSDDKDALDHFFGDLYDDGTEIDPKVKCGKGYSFRFTAKTIANTIEDDETLTKDSNTSSSALANINTPACTTQGG